MSADQASAVKASADKASAVKALLLPTLFLPTILLPTLCPPTAYAEVKIAYVNLDRAFDDYEKTKRLDRQLEERSNAKQAERDTLVAEIRKLKDELELMSLSGREGQQAAIDERLRGLQEFDRQARESLRRARDEAVREILKEIEGVVQGYAQAQGYDLVLSDRAVLYATKSTDITNEIIKALNKETQGR